MTLHISLASAIWFLLSAAAFGYAFHAWICLRRAAALRKDMAEWTSQYLPLFFTPDEASE